MAITGAVDDRNSVKHEEVEAVVRKLCVSYSDIRRSFKKSERRIYDILNEGDITHGVQAMTASYRLPRGFVKRVGYSAKIDSPAALFIQFDRTQRYVIECTLCFQESKSELLLMPRYRLVHIIGHELAHARMQYDMHPLRTSEFATDVLAVLATGNSKEFRNTVVNEDVQYGYIRHDLLDELFDRLDDYAGRIYLR